LVLRIATRYVAKSNNVTASGFKNRASKSPPRGYILCLLQRHKTKAE
jgi:hypothetical protein